MRKKALGHIAVALAVLLLAVSATFAWFKSVSQNRVETTTAKVIASNNIELSLDGLNWTGEVELPMEVDMALFDITGDGIRFWRPILNNANQPDINQTWNLAPNGSYISFTLYMRTTQQVNVYLSAASSVSGNSEILVGTDSGNKSIFGDFSRDLIAGAVRVSVVNETETAQPLRLVWVPNAAYQLIETGGTWVATTTGTPEAAYQYYDEDKVLKTYSQTICKTELTVSPDTLPTTADLPLAELPVPADGDVYSTQAVTVNIWVEGTDREARRALSAGIFSADLHLVAYTPDKVVAAG